MLTPRDTAEALLGRSGRIVNEFGFVDEKKARQMAEENLALFVALDVDAETARALAELLRSLRPEDLLHMREISEREVRAALALWYLTRNAAALAPLAGLLAPVYFIFPEKVAAALCAAARGNRDRRSKRRKI